jgi:hypothetical protein
MKRLSTIALTLILSLFFISAHAQNPAAKPVKAGMNEMSMPYKASYSTNFQVGNSQFTNLILNAWKEWDEGMPEKIASIISDTITAVMPDGMVVKGKADFIKGGVDYRKNFSSVKSQLTAATTLKSRDHMEEEVTMIWGNETATKKDGTVERNQLHEVWVFNKDGQVVFFQQFAGKTPKDWND